MDFFIDEQCNTVTTMWRQLLLRSSSRRNIAFRRLPLVANRPFGSLLEFSVANRDETRSVPYLNRIVYQRNHFFSASASKDDPPFSKVLIANRGEICQRIIKTCKSLGIQTVAIYSTADSKAPFVQAADEAICVGPAQANESYLNVDNVVQAIRDTGAQACHPGYGFLSENSSFCNSIQELGVAWLGPPVSAIRDMGDKLRSKVIAEQAGVNIIPGFEGTIESVDHALEIANQVGYPILLKAAAGGGGKGMRTCYNDQVKYKTKNVVETKIRFCLSAEVDNVRMLFMSHSRFSISFDLVVPSAYSFFLEYNQDVRDGYSLAKGEAKNFFKDDRLLVEKYIENPHHIEFQVLCSFPPGKDHIDSPEELQVVVFPERECSIQRRNQKIVEESPSCLLTEETRHAMVEQVKKLCQTVGYLSAGTVEFLVDEEQNFYFLEMNTRLQVEHPITEAISGTDLVKGMLWVGSGRGLPEEFQIDGTLMPHSGHAVEARIYAEDPIRGYLPSTGPLVPYVEPIATGEGSSYLRMDSGVVQGHVVSPFYDPMLSKVISFAPTRKEAIAGLACGLDQYVIEGVQHNARLVNAVLRHEAFQDGRTPTSFLDKHFPKFDGVKLTESQEEELAVAVALIGLSRQSLQPSVADGEEPLIIRLGGMFGTSYRVEMGSEDATVQRIGDENSPDGNCRTVALQPVEYEPVRHLAHVTLDGIPRSLQVSTNDLQ